MFFGGSAFALLRLLPGPEEETVTPPAVSSLTSEELAARDAAAAYAESWPHIDVVVPEDSKTDYRPQTILVCGDHGTVEAFRGRCPKGTNCHVEPLHYRAFKRGRFYDRLLNEKKRREAPTQERKRRKRRGGDAMKKR